MQALRALSILAFNIPDAESQSAMQALPIKEFSLAYRILQASSIIYPEQEYFSSPQHNHTHIQSLPIARNRTPNSLPTPRITTTRQSTPRRCTTTKSHTLIQQAPTAHRQLT